MKKKKIIAANFKMNKTHLEVREYLKSFFKKLKEFSRTYESDDFNGNKENGSNSGSSTQSASVAGAAEAEIVFAPPFTALNEAYNIIEENSEFRNIVKLASQNVYCESSGAYTGEISIDMIKAFNCTYAIVGHSERRWIFNESEELIAKKISAILYYNTKIAADIRNDGDNNAEKHSVKFSAVSPILCVGENLEIRKSGKAFDFVAAQLDSALNCYAKDLNGGTVQNKDGFSSIKTAKSINSNHKGSGSTNAAGIDTGKLIIAYEPIWAIGTGASIEPEDGEKMHKFIYEYLTANYCIENFSVIYGGSVTEKNINVLMEKDHIDGVLVGGASLDPQSFFNIYSFAVSK
ncbi:MAG: triosephosphate isomerase [Candidatus Acididesulfobacter guangdongensis]|uniref:Triosephosphate isomerase n=1 Tax=Acididesulfobacter guangdongensis TaxID=2597225 RepID=A0A519BIX3_ACIG2|nr:MAG: triosephosphate isomerase [Candidatus Acididesulfobacter guangdongensis]